MKKLNIKIGDKFNRLTVVAFAGRDNKGQYLWDCVCSCGSTKTTPGTRLKGGHVKSCGCLHRENAFKQHKHIRVDLTNKRCGKLTFVKDIGRNKWGHRVWLCKCDCGGETKVSSNNFGKVKSCRLGCYGNPKGPDSKMWKGGVIKHGLMLYDTYGHRLSFAEEVRDIDGLVSTKCTYCGQWFIPSRSEVRARLRFLEGQSTAESRLYCSENCKSACPIYGQHKWPKGFKPATSREVQPELRQLVLERDKHMCIKCGKGLQEVELHCHHITGVVQNPIESADVDNCITLCKKHHKLVHKQKDCSYNDLKCNN